MLVQVVKLYKFGNFIRGTVCMSLECFILIRITGHYLKTIENTF